MKLIDTVAIIGSLNPRDREHTRSVEHMRQIASHSDVYVPVLALIEADLVMKVKGYDHSEREISWRALESKIPPSKILSSNVPSIYSAIQMQREGMDYFDSLISSLAKETNSIVLTPDKAIGNIVRTEW